jgi:putative cell wall-binding protein
LFVAVTELKKMMSSTSRAKVAKQALRRGVSASEAAATGRRSSSTISLAARMTTRRGLASGLQLQQILRSAMVARYSTEKILKSRGAKVSENQKILYNANDEKENCGVGLIANLKSIPSRHVVEVADEMLVRMAHRGGCGCDPASGDGAGKCCSCCRIRNRS